MLDKTFFQSLSVVLAAFAFVGICWWTFAPSRRKKFDEAANLPFADEEPAPQNRETQSQPDSKETGKNKEENKVNSL